MSSAIRDRHRRPWLHAWPGSRCFDWKAGSSDAGETRHAPAAAKTHLRLKSSERTIDSWFRGQARIAILGSGMHRRGEMNGIGTWLQRTFEISPSSQRRLRSMEGLRGFAVLLVFLVHYASLAEPWLAHASLTRQVADTMHDVGVSGVDLFFVLSGYLIYGVLMQRPVSFKSFMTRRIERIYPAFLVVFAIYLVLSWVMPAESKLPASVGAAAWYLVQNLLLMPGLFAVRPLISVAWSLSYEMFSYLMIPLLIAALRLRAWPRPRRMIVLAALAVGMFAASALLHPHLRLVMFLAGMLLHEIAGAGMGGWRERGLGLAALAVGLATVAALSTFAIDTPLRYVALFASFFILCLASFTADGPTSRVFSWTPLRWLGNMSYSYYLIHGLTLKATILFVGKVYPPGARESWGFWLALPAFLAVTLATSTMLFVCVERPFSLNRTRPTGERGNAGARLTPARRTAPSMQPPIDLVRTPS